VLIGIALLLLMFFGQCARSSAPEVPDWPADAEYSVPIETLDAALECSGGPDAPDGSGRGEPVLLVHGTAVTREQNWGWGYWPALRSAGFEVCWVQLPEQATGDIQLSAEYVARAVEVMAERSGEKVDVIGHSQGGLSPRWAIKYFASGAMVDDYVGFASPNHGSAAADRRLDQGRDCPAACWQMRRESDFIAALNAGDETPGDVSYTNIFTTNDELVIPYTSSRLAGAKNVLIQDTCRGRPIDHFLMAGDAVTWELAIDALTHEGGADPERLRGLTCLKLALPGATLDWPEDPGAGGAVAVDSEPPLKPYAR
jgi:triacylglycerol lipase